jgi:hypothetical protein
MPVVVIYSPPQSTAIYGLANWLYPPNLATETECHPDVISQAINIVQCEEHVIKASVELRNLELHSLKFPHVIFNRSILVERQHVLDCLPVVVCAKLSLHHCYKHRPVTQSSFHLVYLHPLGRIVHHLQRRYYWPHAHWYIEHSEIIATFVDSYVQIFTIELQEGHLRQSGTVKWHILLLSVATKR